MTDAVEAARSRLRRVVYPSAQDVGQGDAALANFEAAIRVDERSKAGSGTAENLARAVAVSFNAGQAVPRPESALRAAATEVWVAYGTYVSMGGTHAAFNRHMRPAVNALKAALDGAPYEPGEGETGGKEASA